MTAAITPCDVASYREQGYLLVPNVLSESELELIHRELEHVIAKAAAVTENDEVYDLEDSLLLFQFAAVDAFPLVHTVDDLARFDQMIVAGESTIEPRVTAVPVRMPLPPAPSQGSIYENQRSMANQFFR